MAISALEIEVVIVPGEDVFNTLNKLSSSCGRGHCHCHSNEA